MTANVSEEGGQRRYGYIELRGHIFSLYYFVGTYKDLFVHNVQFKYEVVNTDMTDNRDER